jgi:hypothetical protein
MNGGDLSHLNTLRSGETALVTLVLYTLVAAVGASPDLGDTTLGALEERDTLSDQSLAA